MIISRRISVAGAAFGATFVALPTRAMRAAGGRAGYRRKLRRDVDDLLGSRRGCVRNSQAKVRNRKQGRSKRNRDENDLRDT
jgi:hypothetical protein